MQDSKNEGSMDLKAIQANIRVAQRSADEALVRRAAILADGINVGLMSDPGIRHLRASMIGADVRHLSSLLKQMSVELPLYCSNEGAWVKFGGVWLSCNDTAYYLRHHSNAQSVGPKIDNLLDKYGIVPDTVVDIGANQGEVGLRFVTKYPKSRVIMVEASTGTFSVLQKNVEFELQAKGNVHLFNAAISDKDGSISFTIDFETSNRIVSSSNNSRVEIVDCYSIPTFWKKANIDTVDFLKIDIEGAEPNLHNGLHEVINRIRSMMIEFSDFGEREGYIKLANMIMSNGFNAHWGGSSISFAELCSRLDSEVFGKKGAADIFFGK